MSLDRSRDLNNPINLLDKLSASDWIDLVMKFFHERSRPGASMTQRKISAEHNETNRELNHEEWQSWSFRA